MAAGAKPFRLGLNDVANDPILLIPAEIDKFRGKHHTLPVRIRRSADDVDDRVNRDKRRQNDL